MTVFKRGKIFEHRPVDLGYEDLVVGSDENGRIYNTPDGKKYPSVTTVLGSQDDSWIDEWRARVGDAEADRVCHHGVTRGSVIHDLAERYLKNENDIITSSVMPHHRFGFETLRKVLDTRVGTVIVQEAALYSHYLKLAGRVDLVGYFDNVLSIVDFKTSKYVKTAEDIEDYFIQASFYAAAFYERTGIAVKQIVILMAVDFSPKPLIFIEEPFKWIPKLMKIREQFSCN